MEYRFDRIIGHRGGIKVGFTFPVDVAVDRSDILYVLCRTARVCKWTLDDECVGEFGGNGSEDGQFGWPAGIALDSEDNVYISEETNQRIQKLNRDGECLGKWGTEGDGDGEFNRPSGIAIDSEDNVYVVDHLNHRVQKFAADGVFLTGWGTEGDGDGEFNMPWGIAVDSAGDVYVADWRNDRIQKFNAEGEFLAKCGTSGDGDGQFNRPADVAIDKVGNILVADRGNNRIQVLAPDGTFQAVLLGEANLSKSATAFLNTRPEAVKEREELGPSEREKFFWAPTAITTDTEGRTYIADSCQHRLQVYSQNS